MAPVLWLRFSDENAVPQRLSAPERERLEAIFAAEARSPWSRALSLLGLRAAGSRTGAWLAWRGETPYFNWTAYVSAVSADCVEVIPAPGPAGWASAAQTRVMRLPALLLNQWKASRYLAERLETPLPEAQDEALAESLALGLALQALLLRLPRHEAADLARWLARPERAPARVRATVRLIQRAQERRTRLSRAWERLFPPRPESPPEASEEELPFFWEGAQAPEPAEAAPVSTSPVPDPSSWEALPVHPGRASGTACVIARGADPAEAARRLPPRPRVLVFAQARPETTELFGEADAIVFAEGGALSHACTVARERGIPCVTGAGRAFLKALESRLRDAPGSVLIEIDGDEGRVSISAGVSG